jgi:Mg-chelatase subunit ChlD
MKKTLLICLIFTLGYQLNAQIKFEASTDKVVVGLKDVFTLNFTINTGAISNFNAPDLNQFKIIAGPYSSSSTEIRVINGKCNKTSSYTYSYNILPKKLGTFTIGQASITIHDSIIHDSICYSKPISIEVVPGTKANPDSTYIADSSFVKIELNKNYLYVGEQVRTIIKLYSNSDITSIDKYEFPKFKGFWVEKIGTNSTSPIKEEVDGVNYQTFIIQTLDITPLQTGQLTIDSCKLECTFTKPGKKGALDDFFGNNQIKILKSVNSALMNITVNPLPLNKPKSFTGLVGKDLKIDASISKNSISCSDTVNFNLLISGKANFKLIDKPTITLDSSMIVCDTKITYNTRKTITDTIDTVRYEYTIIPQRPGKYPIKPLAFSYFDISSKEYKTLLGNPIILTVDSCNHPKTINKKESNIKKEQTKAGNIAIVFDVSSSMLVMDLEPNRLKASKTVVTNFIKRNSTYGIGLVVFAGDSYSLCPLTNNLKASEFVSKIDTGMVEDGTAIGVGLLTAINQLKDNSTKQKCVILLTDGVNNSGEIDPITAAQIARRNGIRLFTIGIGAKDSAMYPFLDTILQKIPAQIDEKTLGEMAHIANGKYFRAKSNNDLTVIFNKIDQLLKIPPAANHSDKKMAEISDEMANSILNAMKIKENMLLDKKKNAVKN